MIKPKKIGQRSKLQTSSTPGWGNDLRGGGGRGRMFPQGATNWRSIFILTRKKRETQTNDPTFKLFSLMFIFFWNMSKPKKDTE